MSRDVSMAVRRERPLSAVLFLAGECLCIGIAALAAASPHMAFPTKSAFVALALLAAASLLGYQAGWRGTRGLVGVAAAVALAALLAMVLQWLPRGDVFMLRCCRGGTRAGTVWPLLFVWALGSGLLAFMLWGALEPWSAAMRRASARSAVWWLLVSGWSLACAMVLWHNVTGAVLWASLLSAGKLALFLGVPLALLGAALSLLSRRARVLNRRVDAEFEAMPHGARIAALDLIGRHALAGEFQYLYRCVEGATSPSDVARINGAPLARAGEVWPGAAAGEPAWFLLQLPLDVPRLGPAWQTRVAVVFLGKDYEVIVRMYDPCAESGLVTLPPDGPSTAAEGFGLQRLAVPYVPVRDADEEAEEDDAGGFDVANLPAQVPGLGALLAQYSADSARLLERVLAGRSGPSFTSASDEILVGGDPLLIQGAHEPQCSACGQPLRFLFQLGELSQDWLFGDAGVCYVYGCDAHPDRCEGIVDSH
jgi:hypothetical protein